MRKNILLFVIFFITSLLISFTGFFSFCFSKQPTKNFLKEEFESLADWKPLYFPKIKKYSQYKVVNIDGVTSLRAESDGSASGIVFNKEFNINTWPILKWRWKVNSVYQKGDATKKAGDDYPLRIYVLFKYDPETMGLWDKVTYESARILYGEYPPHSSLNYIWANRKHEKNIIINRFTDRAMLILMEKGTEKIGRWLQYEVNIVEDYKRAFGKVPPAVAGIAIMNDSDNTGEKSVSWVDFIEVSR